MTTCTECAQLRAENEKLKARIKALEALAKPPAPKCEPTQEMHPRFMHMDIAARTLPPAKPRGPQC